MPWKPAARVIAALLIAVIAALSLAASAPVSEASAHRRTCPTGPTHNPYNIKFSNAVAAPYASVRNSDQYSPIISWSSGRKFSWHGITCVNDRNPEGYWENYKGQVLSANNNCTQWELKNSRSDNGTVTIDVQRTNPNGTHYSWLASRLCNVYWKTGLYTKIWASKDIAGKNLVIFNRNHPVSGLYLKVAFPRA